MSKPSPGKGSPRERIESIQSILASKKLTVHRVSQLSESLYGHSSEYFIPHNLYYELTRGPFTPSIYQIAALSRISGYRLAHWLGVFGFDLESIARLEVLLPAKRTLLIDSSLVDPATIVRWLQDRKPRNRNEDVPIPRVAPLSQFLEIGENRQVASVANTEDARFVYAKIGLEDALAFPDLLPGSIVGIDSNLASSHWLAQFNQATSQLFLIEHSQGLFCCRLRRTATDLVIPVSEKLPYGQVELRPSQVKILGAASFEIRPLVSAKHPEVALDLAKRWTPGPLRRIGNLGQLLHSRREKLNFSLQAASSLSRRIAEVRADDRYFISPSSLSDYEASNAPPRHFHKIVTLCALYGIGFANFLERIGISSLGKEPMPDHFIPMRSDPAVRRSSSGDAQPESRGFFAHLLGTLPDVPFFLRNSIPELSRIPDPSLEDFFWIGGETNPLHPLLKGGVIAIVNRRKKKPIHYRSKPLWEQPIYMLLRRDGSYLCACCSAEDHTLVLHPYPQHIHGSIQFRDHRDAEIIGQVVAVVRKLL